MIKKIFVTLFLFLLFLLNPGFLKAKENTIHLFGSPTCPHCLSAKKYFEKLKTEEIPNLVINEYEISKSIEEIEKFYKKYEVPKSEQGLVPAIFVGDKYFIGFSDQIGEQIKSHLMGEEIDEKAKIIKLPFLGEVDILNFSLPVLAITLAVVDGFNVCSLGALMVILGLVMVLRSRKRIFILGGTFILTTGVIYAILILLWHQFFSIISLYIRSMEIVIGLLALVGGIYLLKEFVKACRFGPVCSSNNLLSRLTPKIEKIFQNKTNWFVLAGAVITFASIVTIIEFPCSAFLPVLFTSILANANLSFGMSAFYITIYMLFYLLDEIIIFCIAVLTLRIKIVSPKFIIFFNLLAALIFIFLGIYYIFGWLG